MTESELLQQIEDTFNGDKATPVVISEGEITDMSQLITVLNESLIPPANNTFTMFYQVHYKGLQNEKAYLIMLQNNDNVSDTDFIYKH